MIFLAYHDKSVIRPIGDNLKYICTRYSELNHELYSELSAVSTILEHYSGCENNFGLMHYRRMFFTDLAQELLKGSEFTYEYGKRSRPVIKMTDDNFKKVTNNFKLELGESDIIVLEKFKKSKKYPLKSLVEIGWIHEDIEREFWKYLKTIFTDNHYEQWYNQINNSYTHYCNNIMYSNKKNFFLYWSYCLNVITGFHKHIKDVKKEDKLTPRVFGYFAEYIMKPIINDLGFNVKTQKSICLK